MGDPPNTPVDQVLAVNQDLAAVPAIKVEDLGAPADLALGALLSLFLSIGSGIGGGYLLAHATTTAGLTLTAVKDSNTYPIGIRIANQEFDALELYPNDFHGEWNYSIRPRAA